MDVMENVISSGQCDACVSAGCTCLSTMMGERGVSMQHVVHICMNAVQCNVNAWVPSGSTMCPLSVLPEGSFLVLMRGRSHSWGFVGWLAQSRSDSPMCLFPSVPLLHPTHCPLYKYSSAMSRCGCQSHPTMEESAKPQWGNYRGEWAGPGSSS